MLAQVGVSDLVRRSAGGGPGWVMEVRVDRVGERRDEDSERGGARARCGPHVERDHILMLTSGQPDRVHATAKAGWHVPAKGRRPLSIGKIVVVKPDGAVLVWPNSPVQGMARPVVAGSGPGGRVYELEGVQPARRVVQASQGCQAIGVEGPREYPCSVDLAVIAAID